MKKLLLSSLILISLTSCSELALLKSTGSVAQSNKMYAKVYSGTDILTIMSTDKSIKGHAYDNAKKAWAETKEGKKYIYDQSIDLFKRR